MSKYRTTQEGGLPGILPLPGATSDEETSIFRKYSRQSVTPLKFVIGAVACVALVFVGYLAVSSFSTTQIQTQNAVNKQQEQTTPPVAQAQPAPQSQPAAESQSTTAELLAKYEQLQQELHKEKKKAF